MTKRTQKHLKTHLQDKRPKSRRHVYNVCTWDRGGGASAERFRKTYIGLLEWAELLLCGSRASHIDVTCGHRSFKLALVGGRVRRTEVKEC